jgi:hypothetical protein
VGAKTEIHQPIQCDLSYPNPKWKIALRFSEVYDFHKAILASQRGVTANRHETWARDAMDAKVSSARAFCADERHRADGEDVWSWHPWAGAKSANDDLPATVTRRSWTPGRARTTSLKPSRREGRIVSVYLW